VTKLHLRVLGTGLPAYLFASRVGIHNTTLSSYVRGQKPILEPHVKALCYVLGCEPDDVVGWVEMDDLLKGA
jgi:DNA-binding Xre family transcriptional regulator